MRRGLISRSHVELPDAALEARLGKVHAAMQEAGLDALLIYTNISRAAGVSWLTGFVPYWSEALLVVPRGGAPYLVAALTFRVKPWIERTSRLGEVLHTPRIGLKAGQQIAAAKPAAAVGVVDLDGLAAGIVADLHEGGAALTLRDATALFAKIRGRADATEIALAAKAAAIAHRALGVAQADRLNAMIGEIEGQARRLGAEEILIAAAPDLDRDTRLVRIEGEPTLGKTFALRATVAYKGAWVRLVRTFCDPPLMRQAAEQLAAAVAPLPDGAGFTGFRSWVVEGCRTSQPLAALMGSRLGASQPPPHGALVSAQAGFVIEGQPVLVGAPALLGQAGEAASLLAAPLYE